MTTQKNDAQPPATVQNFPIVGIGASAGGLDAFKSLLKAIPEDSGMAYVLVQHLDPSHESILPEILQRVTKIPVHEITDDIHLAPNHIYVIPSNKLLISTDGVLQLSDREKKISLTIDIFFTSLAEVHKECAVGIVLSGTGKDGTQGLKAIKEHGGISIVQDPGSAAYDGMPQSAIDAGLVDFILHPEKIPAQLLQINNSYKTNHFFIDQNDLPKDDESVFKQIISILRQRSGVDFTHYKQPTFHRRIARRIAIAKKKNLADYLKLLRTNKAEQDALFQDVLIPVTAFFRDPKTFEALTETVFPALFKNKTVEDNIRIWIAGCSTGEEAYSIAICLHEFLGDKLSNTKIQVFASDISEKSIKKARAAIYTKADVEKITATQLKNYFIKNNGGYEVSKLIRDMCVFAPHNFLKDPPFAKMDIITCRNVLIYMNTFLQQKALTTFHYALKENGFLILGKSETIGASSNLFAPLSKHEKIYSRKAIPGRFMHVATETAYLKNISSEEGLPTTNKFVNKQEAGQADFRKSAEAVMILKSPSSVVVNQQMDIVHIHGDITPFLQAPQGKPTHNLIKMAREGLAFELRNAIHRALKEQTSVIKENIPVNTNGKQYLITIEIIPLTDTIEPHYLIRFEKIIPIVQVENISASSKSKATQTQNLQLEKELSQTREDMRFITEDMEAANEELQSANEELQSSNEEMQSLNEELETSKEELQSTNEELTIVNHELVDKQEQLNASHFYAESIVSTIREPLVVLDKTLRIKNANASFYKIFNAEEHEIEGKLFYEIQNKQWDDPMMRSLLEKILPLKERLVDFEILIKLPSLGERHLLMNALQIIGNNTSEQLMLLAIEDITEKVVNLKKIEESEMRLKLALKASANTAFAQDENLKYTWIYNAIPEFNAVNLLGKDDSEILEPETAKRLTELKKEVLNSGIASKSEVVVTFDGTNSIYELVIEPIKNNMGKVIGISGVSNNITEKVVSHKKIVASEKRFSNILSQSLLAIAILKGPEMIISFANEPIIAIWGKGKNIFDKPLLEVMPEIKDQLFPTMLMDVYSTGVAFATNEIKTLIKRNGKLEECYFNLIYQPYRDVDDTITGVTVLATEITDYVFAKKQLEENGKRLVELADSLELKVIERTDELHKLNEELKHTNKQLDQFAYIASHDLQEPLRKIITFSTLLKDKFKDGLSAEVKSYLDRIEGSSLRMSTLIRDLLNYSRLLQYEKLFVQTDLNETLKSVLSDFELLIQEKNAQIIFDELPTIEAIKLHMNQLFYNLISNALKFSKEDVPPVISITSHKLSEKEIQKYPNLNPLLTYVKVIFKDNGIGFDQHYSKQIFDIFQRLHSKDVFIGTGIGLALSKKIVEDHHGELFTLAKENLGAAFHVILPIKQLA